jgi:hypothetical protein
VVIRGSATVTITQAEAVETRALLTAGNGVDAEASDTSADVTFTGAAGLTGLAASDFTVSDGGTITNVDVSGDTAAVTVSFASNTDSSSRTYTAGISAESTLVYGTGTVTILQAGAGETRTLLTAGQAVDALAADTGADVTFSGATGLSLTSSDFTVSDGGTVTSVNVTSDTVTVTVTFTANNGIIDKTYTVGINPASTVIRGAETVTITQSGIPRTELTAGPEVNVDAAVFTADVTFTGASGLSLEVSDFTVTTGGTIGTVAVNGGTATVTVTFPANTSASAKTYTIGINPESMTIKGSGTVKITQDGKVKKTLTQGPAVNVEAGATVAHVIFTGASGLVVGTNLETTDFTVTTGGSISAVSVTGDTATVTVSFAANTTASPKTYTVGISPTGADIQGAGTVTITQAAAAVNNAYYVSFSGGDDSNNGTSQASPWKTIAKVNSQTFQPGDHILFKAGDTWTWAAGESSLAPQGSGTAGSPIIISSYGDGAKPKFEGKGLVDDVIHLHNQQYWEISNLEISNTVEGFTNPASRTDSQGSLLANKDLRGIFISGNNGQTLSGFNLHDLYIHDVTGQLCWIGPSVGATGNPAPIQEIAGVFMKTGWDGSKRTGAIFVEGQSGTNPTIFNNVTVENNILERNSFGAFTIKQYIGGSGGPKWGYRSNNSYPYTDSNFKPHTNITVRGNYIDQTGWYKGNGLYITNIQGGLVEKNVIKNPGVCGIEMYLADSITVQYNEVYGSTSKGNGGDTNGIDPDVKTTNIILQYNYVHDNGDGFLLCGGDFNTVLIRHNVLYNNTKIWLRDAVSRGIIQAYNNVFYNAKAQDTAGTVKFTGTTSSAGGSEVWEFKNNVFYNAHSGTTTASFLAEANCTYSNNFYYGGTPTSKDTAPFTGDPGFTGTPAFSTGTSAETRFEDFSFFIPAAGSPMINRGIAYTVPNNKIDVSPNGKDYAGTTMTGTADIGLYASDFKGLSGIVYNIADEPAGAGVTVKLNETTQTITDAAGKYSFPSVSQGPYTITVSAEGFEDGETSFTANADAVSWLPLTTGDYQGSTVKNVTGTVTSGGTGLAGAKVTITKGATTITATTGGNGVYTLVDVPSGSGYTIAASKEGYESKSTLDFVVPLNGNPDTADFDLISSTHVYYNEDFNTLNDWTVVTNGNTAEIITDPDDSNNKLLHFNKTSSGSSGSTVGIYNKTAANAYGIFTIETRMKRSVSSSSGTGQYHLYTYQSDKFTGNGSSNPSANIVFVGGQIKTHLTAGNSAVTNMQAYSANTWYEIAMRVNTATDTFDFYVDGVKKGSGSIRTAVDEIDIFNITCGTTGSGFEDFWVDYIKVYQGDPEFLGN